jgi:hypothetical protein
VIGRHAHADQSAATDFVVPGPGWLALEKICLDTVQSGDMTRDLAILIRADHPWLTTNQFLDKIDANLQRAMR